MRLNTDRCVNWNVFHWSIRRVNQHLTLTTTRNSHYLITPEGWKKFLMKRLLKNIQIGHFRIPKPLNFKMRLNAELFGWKCTGAHDLQENKNIFTSKSSRFPRFQAEAQDNLKMSYNELNTQDTKIDGTVPGNASLVYWVLLWVLITLWIRDACVTWLSKRAQ